MAARDANDEDPTVAVSPADALRDHLEALYPFPSAPCLEPFAAFIDLAMATDPTGGVAPPPLIPMVAYAARRVVFDDAFAVDRLHHAAYDGKHSLVLAAVSHGLPLRDATSKMHIVHAAAAGGQLQLLRALSHLTDVGRDAKGNTVTQFAAFSDSVATVEYCLQPALHYGDIDSLNYNKSNLLSGAAYRGSLDVLEYALARCPSNAVAQCNVFNMNALHLAASTGDVAKLRRLLAVPGADPKAAMNGDGTIAHLACRSDNIAAIELAVGIFGTWADVPQTNRANGSLVSQAGSSRTPAVFDYVRAHAPPVPDGRSPLIAAASKARWAMMRHLLRLGYDPDALESDGYNVLLASVESSNVNFVRYVYGIVSDATRKAYSRGAPFVWRAVQSRHVEILEFGLDQGLGTMADKNSSGASLVLAAILSGSPIMLRYCLDNGGGSLDDTDDHGRSVATYQRHGTNPDIVREAAALPCMRRSEAPRAPSLLPE